MAWYVYPVCICGVCGKEYTITSETSPMDMPWPLPCDGDGLDELGVSQPGCGHSAVHLDEERSIEALEQLKRDE